MTSSDITATGSEDLHYGVRPVFNFLSTARNHYLSQYRSFIDNQRKAGRAGEPEVMLETDDDTLFDRLLVADYLITNDEPHVVRFQPGRQLEFAPQVVTINGMTVSIERLRWDEVVVVSDAPLPSKEALQVWFEEWTEARDNADDHHEPLANVMHSVRMVDEQIQLDLGSAPPQSLFDLFLLLNESGAKAVRLI